MKRKFIYETLNADERGIDFVISLFKIAGADLVGYNGEYAYGYNSKKLKDNPNATGNDEIVNINTNQARNFIRMSLLKGHVYGIDAKDKKML
jgi:hypothetical protein